MKSSIFTFIKSYTPSVDRDPKEDYLTQIFSWMLNNIKELDKKYCRYLLDKIGKSNIELNEEMISTETQISVTSGRIDMIISIYNKIGFICEHKVWSNLSDNQITKYKQCSNELGNENYYTVLVTANKLQHTQEADIKLTWADICIFIESIINEYENEDEFVLSNFITYLKEQGLWKYESISINEVTSYYSARKLEKKLDELFMDLVHVEWVKECEHLKTFTKSRYNPNFTKYRWGRKGINFFEDWYPGLFAGVMLDPTDHCIDTKDSYRGPDLVVIINTKDSTIKTIMTSKHGFSDVETLHAEIMNIENYDVEGTDFILENCSDEDMKKAQSNFIKYASYDLLQTTKYGEIYKKSNCKEKSNIYVNGMKIAQEDNCKYY